MVWTFLAFLVSVPLIFCRQMLGRGEIRMQNLVTRLIILWSKTQALCNELNKHWNENLNQSWCQTNFPLQMPQAKINFWRYSGRWKHLYEILILISNFIIFNLFMIQFYFDIRHLMNSKFNIIVVDGPNIL